MIAADGAVSNLGIDADAIWTFGRNENPSADTIVQDVRNLINYFTQKLPKLVFGPLLEQILPSLMVQLISSWLDSSLPLKMAEMESFQQSLSSISELAEYIETFGIAMPSEADLSDWIQKLPVTWISRRREAALADMRAAAFHDVRSKKSAHRVETQMVAHDDIMVTGSQAEDDWNAGWVDESDEQHEQTAKAQRPAGPAEDASAWGLEDDTADATSEKHGESAAAAEEEEDADAWGWGEDGEESTEPTNLSETIKRETNVNGSARHNQPADREITLRETFTITALPDSILTFISQILADAQTLTSPTFPIQQIASAAPALSSIPTLLLALYRAAAMNFYEADPAPNMLLYNDTQHLVSSLKDLIANMPSTHPLTKRLRLDNDIRLLESFAKRAYGREMDSQRTILRDLLSSASGFVNCSAPINAREYGNTILITVDRIREVDRTWCNVLSSSARLQSLGSLLSTVISKMTYDILELAGDSSGISEEQSKVLKGFCEQVVQIADLFEQVDPSTGEKRTLVQAYTPDWFRFIYLGEILDASLADIKYLWTEGELGLEFEMGEIIDLIEALFADSEHRRNAIRDIRNHGGGR
jgi:centromere/kinetochore protein ZW10